jgi:dTDP-4-amino-4,6-dideoxygalactose transaminase
MLAINELSARLRAQRGEILDAIARVIDRGWVVLGPEVRTFEAAFAKYLGIPFCIGLANGTDALELGLRALGVKHGDRVMTVANAGMYGTVAINTIGASPIFLDVDPETQLATFDGVAQAIDGGARALILTHLYGRAAQDTEAIAELCASRRVSLLEDCAQAHGAEIQGRKVGTFGHAAAFSFYPTKNLGAIGDGGAVVTADRDVAERLVQLRQYGWKEKYRSELLGGRNSRLDEIQAAVLNLFLPLLDEQNQRRRAIGARYAAGIRHPKVQTPRQSGADDVVHLYVVRCADRDGLKAWLRENDIGSDIHYPIPDHLQPCLSGKNTAAFALPTTEMLATKVLTLPCFPELSDDAVDQVVRVINAWPR